MKILVLTSLYPKSIDSTDGIFVHHQVRHLQLVGCEMLVVSPVPYTPGFLATNERRKAYRSAPPATVIDGVEVRVPRYLRPPGSLFHPFASYSMYLGCARLLHQVVASFHPDLIHAQTATPDGYTGLLLKRVFGLPLVVSLLGSDINVYPHRDRWTRYQTRRVITEADRITAVSSALKTTAQQLGSPKMEIDVVYTGCDHEAIKFNPDAREVLRKNLAIPRDGLVIAFVGHLYRTKGVYEFLDCFLQLRQKYSNLYALLVGGGTEYEALQAITRHNRAEKVIHFVGQRPHVEIPQWLSACDILVLPSWNEGLPNVVVEAMACERPVVATRVGGIPEVVEDGTSGLLVEKGNTKRLIEAVSSLLADGGRRRLMGAMGRNISKQRFSWDRNAQDTLEIYSEVLFGTPSNR